MKYEVKPHRPLSETHWLTSAIEHPSVLECFAEIERLGGEVAHISPNSFGAITAEALAEALKPETVFVSTGWANHEIGTVQPLSALARAIATHEKKYSSHVIFHSDAGQAPLYIAPQVHTLGVDLLSLDSGKLYGPRGVGALYVSNRADLAPVILGGGQERGLRAGTENVALAAGFAAAFETISRERSDETPRLRKLRDELADTIMRIIPSAVINGNLEHALPHMLNISIPDIESEYITLALDKEGVAISTKSACREGEESRSHVVARLAEAEAKAAGTPVNPWRASNTLRFSFGRATRARDIVHAVRALVKAVKLYRGK